MAEGGSVQGLIDKWTGEAGKKEERKEPPLQANKPILTAEPAKLAKKGVDKAVAMFKGPDLKDIPDPTSPANITAPTMVQTGPAKVVNPLAPNNIKLGAVVDPKGTLIKMSQQEQFRDQQMSLAKQLAMQASGQGPSLAVNALKQGQEANLAATMAQLNSQRGGANPAMARATMQTAAEIQGKAAQEAADARLKEQLGAQGLLATVAGEGRQGDITLATKQADLQQQVALEKYKGDLQLAVEQGRIDQQTALSMFEQANQNARLDADLAAKFQSLAAEYARIGMNAAEANQKAFIEIEKMRAGVAVSQNSQALTADAAKKAQLGQVLQAGATTAGYMYGGPAGGAAAGAASGTMVNQYGQTQQAPQEGQGNFVGPPSAAKSTF